MKTSERHPTGRRVTPASHEPAFASRATQARAGQRLAEQRVDYERFMGRCSRLATTAVIRPCGRRTLWSAHSRGLGSTALPWTPGEKGRADGSPSVPWRISGECSRSMLPTCVVPSKPPTVRTCGHSSGTRGLCVTVGFGEPDQQPRTDSARVVMHLTWLVEEKAKPPGVHCAPYTRPAWFTTREDLKPNTLGRSGVENTAQTTASGGSTTRSA